ALRAVRAGCEACRPRTDAHQGDPRKARNPATQRRPPHHHPTWVQKLWLYLAALRNTQMVTAATDQTTGKVVQVLGNVVDVEFAAAEALPAINTALSVRV